MKKINSAFSNPDFFRIHEKPKEYYMMMGCCLRPGGKYTMLLGDNNRDCTILFSFLQTVITDLEHEYKQRILSTKESLERIDQQLVGKICFCPFQVSNIVSGVK